MASAWDSVGAQMANPVSTSSISPQEIQHELKIFLRGATNQRKVPVDVLSQSALFLLQHMPVARHAVLEYFCNVFDDAAGAFIRHLDLGKIHEKVKDSLEVSVLQNVTKVLRDFIKKTPRVWARIVSTWCLTLLGQISSKYGKHRAMTLSSSSLKNVLQLWMSCPPTRLLMGLATECFAVMVRMSPDSCVDALLEASVQYTPHFDWVVARIGACYPHTIITRVLNCGLKDFCITGHSDTIERDSVGRRNVPKMTSVVSILGHLASKHHQDIRKSMMRLFKEALRSSEDNMKVTTVPFLLQLASMSTMLQQVITKDLISALNPAVLNRLHHLFLSWAMTSPGEYNSFLNLVVHLLMKCKIGAFNILSFIVSAAAPSDTDAASGERVLDEVQDTCVELIHMLLFELQRGVHGRPRNGMGDLPLLDGLSRQTKKLVPFLLQSAQSKRLPWLEKLLVFTAVRSGQNFSAAVLSQIIINASTPSQLALYFHLQESIEKSLKNVAKATVNKMFSSMVTSQGPQLVQTLRNLERVVQGEKKRNKALQATENFLGSGIQSNLLKMCRVLQHPDITVSVAGLRLLNTVGVPHTTDISVLSQLSAIVASLVFKVLWARMEGQDSDSRQAGQRGVLLCHGCLRQMSVLPFTQSQLLHYLLAGCLSQENCQLFGGKLEAPIKTDLGHGDLLIENQRIGLSLQLPRTHASVFHAGVVGQGLKQHSSITCVPREWAVQNQDSLLEAIAACCQSPCDGHIPIIPMETDALSRPFDLSSSLVSPALSEVAARTLGCAVVEAVTVDTLYNDVNWPDPEFSKVTLERDLHVWKQMEDHPVLWSILQAASSSSVFLYYCSPVLKSLMARVLSMLETTRVKHMSDLPLIQSHANRLVYILAQGKFLPAPLSNIGELFPFITPYEGYLLLVTVWRYIKENPPTLNVEQMEARKCDPQHSQVIQVLLNCNIHTMGHLYPRIFNT